MLRQADQARSDFAVIEDSLEFIMAQVSKGRAGESLPGVAAVSFVGGAALATLVTLVIVH